MEAFAADSNMSTDAAPPYPWSGTITEVHQPEAVKIQPFSFPKSAIVGVKVTGLCSPYSANEKVTFTWLKDGRELDGRVKVSSMDGYSTILFNPLSEEDEGNYTCRVTSPSSGSDSFTAPLHVLVPARWDQRPPPQVQATEGSSVSFQCSGSGRPPPTSHWTGPRVTNGSSLVFPRVSRGDQGIYRCLVTNNVGPELESSTFLAVHGSLRIEPFHFSKTAIVGQKTSALCSTTSTRSDRLSFTWVKDGRDLDQRIKVTTFDGVSTIIFNPLTEEDEGNYTCRVTSPGQGSDSYTAPLNVLVPARWEQRPPAQLKAQEGTTLSIPCIGAGKPLPTTLWTGPRVTNGSSLVFAKVTRADQGIYRCLVTNNVGPELEASTFLAVLVPAKFEDKFSVLTVRRGESVTMKCQARGDKPLAIAWSKDKKLLDLDKTPGLEKFEQEVEDGVVSELMVRSATRTDGALYTCFAKNEHGVDERNVKLSVVEVPGKPLDVREDETFTKTVSLTWKGSYTGNSPITRYIVQYWRERGGTAHRLHEETVPSARTRFELKGLKPGTTYAVSIIAENEVGQGEPSDPITVTTAEEDPSGPPTDVKVEAKGSGAILISWKQDICLRPKSHESRTSEEEMVIYLWLFQTVKAGNTTLAYEQAPPREYWNGELKGYRMGYKAVDASSKQFSFKTVDINPAANNTHEYLLTNLLKSTRYAIVVKAFNSVGTGPPSQELMVRTLDGEVPLPPPIALAAATDTSISVRWGDSPAPKIGSSVTGSMISQTFTVSPLFIFA
ncbi:hypothetical protein LAZ67_12002366 [Cordylochernes scorpioides]|uniref:Uncharacterized protein n=1 Tax=Cordylochernes scorpioides TaxID=51811 RepID=A0ABY6L1R0_9ARAC|nr:hypothetical protein LAZ67_12002366 [Cordylochernes scorpioides]